ncbi:MAG: hypothetical protein HQK83_02085 [Fibrobacteria bacterium]|nr:hypothetical protein [Fibrobacteria bacterium]
MPLTEIQKELGRILALNRSEDSYLAGGAAILSDPQTKRYSQDLDYFHDSPERVVSAYEADRKVLEENGFKIKQDINQLGYVRVVVSRGDLATKIEWAHDSSWRFMPVIKSKDFGYQLHPIDSATNKVLALAGRDEPRDLLDTMYVHKEILGLGPLVWAATGKDPGFSPLSLMELLKRRGKIRPEDLSRLHLSEIPNIQQLKMEWIEAIKCAEVFIRSRPIEDVGCLYYSTLRQKFVDPGEKDIGEISLHFGKPGGVLPNILEET